MRLGLLDPPTCVGLRYGRAGSSLEAFLGPHASHFLPCGTLHGLGSTGGFSSRFQHLARLAPHSIQRLTFAAASPHCSTARYRNIDRLSIACALRLRLRPD